MTTPLSAADSMATDEAAVVPLSIAGITPQLPAEATVVEAADPLSNGHANGGEETSRV